jgi:hypothetical protein
LALVIGPDNSVEAMALKYWMKEYAEHGDKVLEVDTAVPIALGAPG